MDKTTGFNSKAAKGGLENQRTLCLAIESFRTDKAGLACVLSVFGAKAPGISKITARESDDTTEKTDVVVCATFFDGSEAQELLSVKLVGSQMGAADRPAHHAARIRISECLDRGLFPSDPFLLSCCHEHFLDGEPMGARDPATLAALTLHWNLASKTIAREAVSGNKKRTPTRVAVCLGSDDGGILDCSTMSAEGAIALLSSEPLCISDPSVPGRVGLVGSRLLSVQRGQSLSYPEQRDVQIKINAMAVFNEARRLDAASGRALPHAAKP